MCREYIPFSYCASLVRGMWCEGGPALFRKPSHDSTVCTTTVQSVNRLSMFTVKVVGIVQLVVYYSVKFAVFKVFDQRERFWSGCHFFL